MPIWTDQYLVEQLEDAEKDISIKVLCVSWRFSIAVTANTAIYTLPDNIKGIRRITWKGNTLNPLNQGELRNILGFKPTNDSTTGTPTHYLCFGYGYKEIRFWPTPNESVAADDSGIDGPDIANRVILTTWRVADPGNSIFWIPSYLRRRTLRYYAMRQAYLKEGQGQNIFASDYYNEKYTLSLNMFRRIMRNTHKQQFRALVPHAETIYMGRPVYPSNFGIEIE